MGEQAKIWLVEQLERKHISVEVAAAVLEIPPLYHQKFLSQLFPLKRFCAVIWPHCPETLITKTNCAKISRKKIYLRVCGCFGDLYDRPVFYDGRV